MISLTIKTNFSVHHLLASALFSRLAVQTESRKIDIISEDLISEHRAYVVGAILSSVAALESRINEVYLAAVDNNPHTFKDINSNVVGLLGRFWTVVEKERMPILQKYQLALFLGEKSEFDKGKYPFQDADALIDLRNTLMHYKPEWDNNLDTHKKIESRLKSKFTHNPFSHQNDVFFPIKCLGHGCAAWAVTTTIRFIEDFYTRMGLSQGIESYKDRLGTE